jgi:methyltransferase (TIGR00027 family)
MRPNTASSTARMVARGVYYVARVPAWKHLVPTEALPILRTLLLTCSPNEERFLASLESPFVRGMIGFIEACITPGILVHYALRKRYLESVTEKAIAEGVRQIVVLGAGLDTLALRQHRWHPTVTFIEVDHPDTQQVKRRALETGNLAAPEANFDLVAADLGKRTVSEALTDCPAFDPQADTLFIAEGLLMYLTEDEIGRLFFGIREAIALSARCRFAFTFLERQANGQPNFAHSGRLLDRWLRHRGEPFRWGIAAAQLPAWMTPFGFTAMAIATPADLRTAFLAEAHPPIRINGDLICIADRA